jgi:hypothetical protein
VTLTLNANGTITFGLAATSGWGFHNSDFGFNMADSSSGQLSATVDCYSFAGSDPGNPASTDSLCGRPMATLQSGWYGGMGGFGQFDAGWNGGTG